jgi:mRNA interferase MazF
MGAPMRGKVVVVPFPFADLSNVTKRRPALVVADLTGDDVILCQITSQKTQKDSYSIAITNADFSIGSLNQDSNVRPNRLFTADSNIIAYEVGTLKDDKFDEVLNMLVGIFTGKI